MKRSGHCKAKVGIISLGCPRNLVDSETLLGTMESRGCRVTDIDKADVGIVNTCAFINDARKESVDAILDLIDLKKEGKLKKVIACGCLVQRYPQELRKEFPEVDAFIGRLPLGHTVLRHAITPSYYAYLKIAEGCVNRCSFCAIPGIKGPFTSLGAPDILRKVKEFGRRRLSELNIIGQDLSGYGLDLYRKRSLPGLLRKIAGSSSGIGWIRLLYLYPHPVVLEVASVIRDNPKFCRYIDIPVQHINCRILKAMNRSSGAGSIRKLIAGVRKTIPGVALRTSLIVGFPGETDKEFEELLQFVRETRFERLGAFAYSREEGTPAYDLKGQIPEKVKSERLGRIMLAQQEISSGVNSGFLGKKIKVLIEERQGECFLARSEFDAPEVDGLVYVHSRRKLKPGGFAEVKITDTLEYDLVGETIR